MRKIFAIKKETWFKVGWYLLSMWLFVVIVFILTIKYSIGHLTGDSFEFKSLWNLNVILSIFAILVFLFDVWFYIHLRYGLTGMPELSVPIAKTEERNVDMLSFLASYFIPLVSFDVTKDEHQIVMLLFFVAIGMMYVKGNVFHLNPTLLILGFKLYNCEVDKRDGNCASVLVLSKFPLNINSRFSYRMITDKLWIACQILQEKKI